MPAALITLLLAMNASQVVGTESPSFAYTDLL